MTRFYFALAVLVLLGLHESLVAMLAANVVGFSLPPVLVFELLGISPFILILANGLPSLFSLLPQAAVDGPMPTITVNATNSPTDAGATSAALLDSLSRAVAASAPRSQPAPIVSIAAQPPNPPVA